ncbi:MAG: hypothetical protein EB060_12440 [Proteobacteria bacterium]|nr:hypothetical protein [Pseudomonadota bacterium]
MLTLNKTQMSRLSEMAQSKGWAFNTSWLYKGEVIFQVPGEVCARVIYRKGRKSETRYKSDVNMIEKIAEVIG